MRRFTIQTDNFCMTAWPNNSLDASRFSSDVIRKIGCFSMLIPAASIRALTCHDLRKQLAQYYGAEIRTIH